MATGTIKNIQAAFAWRGGNIYIIAVSNNVPPLNKIKISIKDYTKVRTCINYVAYT